MAMTAVQATAEDHRTASRQLRHSHDVMRSPKHRSVDRHSDSQHSVSTMHHTLDVTLHYWYNLQWTVAYVFACSLAIVWYGVVVARIFCNPLRWTTTTTTQPHTSHQRQQHHKAYADDVYPAADADIQGFDNAKCDTPINTPRNAHSSSADSLQRTIQLPLSLSKRLANVRFGLVMRLSLVWFYLTVTLFYALAAKVGQHLPFVHTSNLTASQQHYLQRYRSESDAMSNDTYSADDADFQRQYQHYVKHQHKSAAAAQKKPRRRSLYRYGNAALSTADINSTQQMIRHVSSPSERHRKHTLVLDLDETLVHTTLDPAQALDCDAVTAVKSRHHGGGTRQFYIFHRPHLALFLRTLSQYYELVLFTASVRKYADAVLSTCEGAELIKRRYYRNTCQCDNNDMVFVKDLSKVSTSLKRCVIVDNLPASYALHKSNGICISSYVGDSHDTELKTMIPILIRLAQADDVRTVLSHQADEDTLLASYQLPFTAQLQPSHHAFTMDTPASQDAVLAL